jgi:membrane protease YdiL (CAAX protease family)
MPLPPTFALLALAILAAWCPALRLGHRRIAAWTPLLGVAMLVGVERQVLAPQAVGALAALCLLAWAGLSAPRARPLFVALAALLALALSLHAVPGFRNPVRFDALRLTPDATPFTLYLNFDKGAAGLVLLAAFGARATSWRAFASRLPAIGVAAPLTAAAAIGTALAAGYVRFEPKLPDATLAFLLANLFFTCVAEEAFFRGLIQERLMRLADARGSAAWNGIALGVSAVLFGLAHAGGGATWMAVATVAGLGYAWTYARTRTLEGPILVHFAVNAAHFLLFTYPALAR